MSLLAIIVYVADQDMLDAALVLLVLMLFGLVGLWAWWRRRGW